jgi:hypothetical protein
MMDDGLDTAGGAARVFADAEGNPESRRAEAFGRLRHRYAQAQEHVSDEFSGAADHSNLDWILGLRRDTRRDEAAIDTSVCELVVLWLEDLALELERPDTPVRPASGREAVAGSRLEAAEGLRHATRDFADAFLGMGVTPVRRP